ncbi:hypothetical protein GY50_1060 [Dehalococcoides mccartyi GY50]|nr:hypothetical protein GY50_1060 [Dehalococcoides mccartyi GY50]
MATDAKGSVIINTSKTGCNISGVNPSHLFALELTDVFPCGVS